MVLPTHYYHLLPQPFTTSLPQLGLLYTEIPGGAIHKHYHYDRPFSTTAGCGEVRSLLRDIYVFASTLCSLWIMLGQ